MTSTREGRVFVCAWKRTPDGFDVWVKRRRSLRASAATFEQADELLTSAITLATGDGENEHEYDPPRPDTATDEGLLRRFKLIAGGGWATLANEAELWTRGVCPTCQRAWGRRTDRAAVLATLEAVADGLIAKPRTGWALRLQLYSNEFLRLLTVAERRRFEWWPAVAPRRTKRQYFEIVGSRATFPLATFKVAYVGHSLFTCPTCRGRNDPWYSFLPPTPTRFISASDLPSRVPSCFTVGTAAGPAVCFTEERWAALVGRRGTRGLRSSDVGVVDPRLVDRRPRRKLFGAEP